MLFETFKFTLTIFLKMLLLLAGYGQPYAFLFMQVCKIKKPIVL